MSHLSPLLQQSSDIIAERGEGAWLIDRSGQRFLDFTSGIGVTGTGHCHPRVVSAAQEQMGRLIHGQYTTVSHPSMLELTDRLADKLPGDIDSLAFVNSGSEAVEMAIRLVRHATGRSNIIAFTGGFHGRTVGAASLTTSTTKVRSGFHPMMAGVAHSPFPHPYRYGWSEEETTRFCLDELDHVLLTQSAPDDTAAMIVEPMQGEYGYYPANRAFMHGLRERCDAHGILLIVDEIQAGYGRTGRFWSHDHFDVTPDVLITAKGLASGLPLSAVAASRELMARGRPGSQGGTYGGNAVACAAALATLDVIEDEGLVENAARMGEIVAERLDDLCDRFEEVDAHRGLGLMQGLEIVDENGRPHGARAGESVKAAEAEGLLLLRCGTHGQIIRWLPPLIVNESEIDEGFRRFEAALHRA